MPELPEIETVKLQLGKVLVDQVLEGYAIMNPKSVQGNLEVLKSKSVNGIRRRAKVLLIDFSGEYTIAFHFKMSGQLVYESNQRLASSVQSRIVGGHPTEDFVGKLPSSHTRIAFKFTNGMLYFNDQRMFGWAKVDKTEEINTMSFLEKLGPEPWDMTDQQFIGRIGKIGRPIKVAIMDQEVIAGVGNIYANDALWEAKINPQTPSHKLQREQAELLFDRIKLVLEEGIKYGGATAADAKYINLHGLGGHYQEHFRTYDRTGEKCLRNDGGIIEKSTLGGRGTYFCPICQK